MIRMGKSSRPEQSDTSHLQHQSSPYGSGYSHSEGIPSSSRAITDSESMARDIKEGRLSGFVGHGTVLSGETNFQAMLRVDGHLVGSVSSDSGTLIVGSNGQVDANIAVSAAMINGVVNGDIVASERIQLGRTARVVGNIQTPRIIIEDGAILEGSCAMVKAREAIEKQSAEPEPQYRTESARYDGMQESTLNEEIDNLLAAADEEDDEDDDEEKTNAAVV
ncbi:MAG TPA: hypothetical protein DEA22_03395 [Blastocatellia bacterium]|nr:hypothetical protein [Blastocatellia bacterium]